MSALHGVLKDACAKGRRAPARQAMQRGQLLGLIPTGGQWLAVVTLFRSTPGGPVLSELVPVVELKGSARRKADRWVESLS